MWKAATTRDTTMHFFCSHRAHTHTHQSNALTENQACKNVYLERHSVRERDSSSHGFECVHHNSIGLNWMFVVLLFLLNAIEHCTIGTTTWNLKIYTKQIEQSGFKIQAEMPRSINTRKKNIWYLCEFNDAKINAHVKQVRELWADKATITLVNAMVSSTSTII